MTRIVYAALAAVLVATTALAAHQPAILAAETAAPVGTTAVVDDTAGNQTDPHMSGDLVAYTSQIGTDTEIRYASLATGAGGVVPGGEGPDRLADISGDMVVFTRTLADRSAIFRFDISQGTVSEVDPQPQSRRRNPEAAGSVIVWEDFGPVDAPHESMEIAVYDLDTGSFTRLTEDAADDARPDVSPDGTLIVWEKCAPGPICEIWQATVGEEGWTAAQLTAAGAVSTEPATDGQVVVYQSDRGGETDLYWQLVGGGREQRLALPGAQARPSISGNLVAFESANPDTGLEDILVYDLSTSDLHQITDTPERMEALADIQVDQSGAVHVVYTTRDADLNVYAFSFQLPADDTTPPTLLLPDDIVVDAVSPDGAPVDYAASAVDEADGELSVTCGPPPGSVFAIGETTVTCAAVDTVGNHSEGGFTVTVRGAGEQLDALLALIDSFDLRRGTDSALQAEIRIAQRLLDRGHEQAAGAMLRVFELHVRLQDGRALTPEQAGQLLVASQRIKAVIGA